MRITIKSDSAVAVVETMGAELKSLQDTFGTEYMWQADKKYWQKTAPVLFPSIGNTRNDKTLFNGVEYPMPKHGFANRSNFKVVYQGEDKVILSLLSNEETKTYYPYDFNFQIIYSIEGCCVNIQYDVFNMGTETMPFMIGAHPAFNVPIGAEEDEFDNYYLEFAEEETTDTPVFNMEDMYWESENRVPRLNGERRLMLNHKLFYHDAILFDRLKSKSVTLASIRTGRGVQMDFPDFEEIAFWTPYQIDSPFLCLEPWCGSAIWDKEDDEFAHRHNMQFVEPDEKKTYRIKVQML